MAARQLVALDEAGEIHRQPFGAAQHRRGVANLARALQILCPDVEQRDARALQPHGGARISGAHHRELEEEIGRASWRERVCQYVSISGVAVAVKKKKKK